VAIDNRVIFNNGGKCGNFPDKDNIIQIIEDYRESFNRGLKEPAHKGKGKVGVSNTTDSPGCSCCGGGTGTIQGHDEQHKVKRAKPPEPPLSAEDNCNC